MNSSGSIKIKFAGTIFSRISYSSVNVMTDDHLICTAKWVYVFITQRNDNNLQTVDELAVVIYQRKQYNNRTG